jgi:hypothetical protein
VGKFLPNGTNGGNIPKSNMLMGYFLPYGKKSHRIFSPVGFFRDILKTTTNTGVTFGKFHMGRNSNHLIERVYAHFSKKWMVKFRTFGRSGVK